MKQFSSSEKTHIFFTAGEILCTWCCFVTVKNHIFYTFNFFVARAKKQKEYHKSEKIIQFFSPKWKLLQNAFLLWFLGCRSEIFSGTSKNEGNWAKWLGRCAGTSIAAGSKHWLCKVSCKTCLIFFSLFVHPSEKIILFFTACYSRISLQIMLHFGVNTLRCIVTPNACFFTFFLRPWDIR